MNKCHCSLYELALKVSADRNVGEILREKRHDVRTVRAKDEQGQSCIVKLFRHDGVVGLAKRCLHVHSAYREWRGLNFMTQQGVLVPRPLACFRLKGRDARHSHAVVTSDLGQSVRGSDYIREKLKAGDLDAVRRMNEDMIDATAGLIASDLYDGDHTLTNFVIPADGRAYRLDFECARYSRNLVRHTSWYAETLARLIVTYAFCSEAYGQTTIDFVGQLFERIKPGGKVLQVTGRRVGQLMALHNKQTGDDCHIQWQW